MGLDPGVYGAIAVIAPGHLSFTNLPTWKEDKTKDRADYFRLNNYLTKAAKKQNFAIFEDNTFIGGAGANTQYSYGWNNGVLRGMVIAHKIPFCPLRPEDWQRELIEPIYPYFYTKEDKRKSKEVMEAVVVQILGEMDLGINPEGLPKGDKLRSGIFDAIGMAIVAYRMGENCITYNKLKNVRKEYFG